MSDRRCNIHIFQGNLIFHESREFMIELVTTTAEGENDSSVNALYTSIDNNSILLQVVSGKQDVLKCLFIYLLMGPRKSTRKAIRTSFQGSHYRKKSIVVLYLAD